jgi:23S rRNA (pseudouridine1915-N3)-methyltransferase
MKIRLLAVGTRLPGWINEGVDAYARRLPAENSLHVEELALSRRGAAVERVRDEGERLLKKVDRSHHVVVLDEAGNSYTSRELAEELDRWRQLGTDVALLVGGPDGLADACRDRANGAWSLSRHTLPHGLVRVLVAEQIYRAWTLLTGHPYHRD